mgnify:CR=1 FL=1
MLVYLSVEDIVLIDKLELYFKNGFTVFTGETGAGKSIIIDAVSLILGKRSEKRFIKKGSKKATVSALFQINKEHSAAKFARLHGFDIDDEIILRRQVLINGRSNCYLNDQIITLNFMKEIGNLLIEVHGQNDQAGLLDNSNHMSILDEWSNIGNAVKTVSNIFNEYKESKILLHKTKDKFIEYKQNKDSLNLDLKEIKNLNLKINESEELLKNRKILMSSEKIKSALHNLNFYINGDENNKSLYEKLGLAKKELESIVALNEKFISLKKFVDQTIIEIKELEIELDNCINSIDLSNLDVEYIESRLFNLRKVASKHNVEINELDKVQYKLIEQLKHLDEYEINIKKLGEVKDKNMLLYKNKSMILSSDRIKSSKRLINAINLELPILKLENAKFNVKIEKLEENKWANTGIDSVKFEVETNKGTGFHSIGKIASGGELSRLMLAIKVSLLSDKDSVENKKTIIFDEVDAGVGGAVADAIGKRLQILGNNNQVLVVTHHPQVAVRSSNHLKVFKNILKNFSKINISNLEYDDKLEEIARMLSGEKITDAARKAAESLLEEVKR